MPAPEVSQVGHSLAIEGRVSGEGSLTVDGRVEGYLVLSGDLIVSQGGTVRADVQARRVTLHGAIHGDVTATESVSLLRGSRLVGNVSAPDVRIEDGASFCGRVVMQPQGRAGKHGRLLVMPRPETDKVERSLREASEDTIVVAHATLQVAPPPPPEPTALTPAQLARGRHSVSVARERNA